MQPASDQARAQRQPAPLRPARAHRRARPRGGRRSCSSAAGAATRVATTTGRPPARRVVERGATPSRVRPNPPARCRSPTPRRRRTAAPATIRLGPPPLRHRARDGGDALGLRAAVRARVRGRQRRRDDARRDRGHGQDRLLRAEDDRPTWSRSSPGMGANDTRGAAGPDATRLRRDLLLAWPSSTAARVEFVPYKATGARRRHRGGQGRGDRRHRQLEPFAVLGGRRSTAAPFAQELGRRGHPLHGLRRARSGRRWCWTWRPTCGAGCRRPTSSCRR